MLVAALGFVALAPWDLNGRASSGRSLQSFCSIAGGLDGGALASGLSVVGVLADVAISAFGSARALPSIFSPHAAVRALTSTRTAALQSRGTGPRYRVVVTCSRGIPSPSSDPAGRP